MPLKFFQKQAKPSLFKRKTVFKYKNNSRKIKKQPPKRIFIKRKVTWFTIFCTAFFFPLLVKVARAVGNATQTLGQHAGPTLQGGGSGGAVAGGAAAAGVVGASMGAGLLVWGVGGLLGYLGLPAASLAICGYGATIVGFLLSNPIGWIIAAVAIIAIALFAGLAAAGVLGDCDCGGCAGCGMCGGSSATPMDTTGVQQGASQQANVGTSPS